MQKANNITSVNTKSIGVPTTNKEKFDRLSIINPDIDKLKNIFGLEIEL